MDRNTCISCLACEGGKCDQCTTYDICVENMRTHKEIFKLGDQFPNQVYLAEIELLIKTDEIKNNLSSKCNTKIDIPQCCINHCELFLDEMRNKCEEMTNKTKKLEDERIEIKRKYEKDKINMINDYNEKIKNINETFEKEKFMINNEIKKEDLNKNEINVLEERKENLMKEKENIKDSNINDIVESFIDEETPNFENKYKENIKSIDEKYKKVEEKLEYTEEEKKLENNYLNTINNIKKYSDKIPYFDNWIKIYNLNKYINNNF